MPEFISCRHLQITVFKLQIFSCELLRRKSKRRRKNPKRAVQKWLALIGGHTNCVTKGLIAHNAAQRVNWSLHRANGTRKISANCIGALCYCFITGHHNKPHLLSCLSVCPSVRLWHQTLRSNCSHVSSNKYRIQ